MNLDQLPTGPAPELDRDDIEKRTKKLVDRLGELQEMLFAQKKYSVLVIFQGMDASGKDGAVRTVFEECHPQGLQVVSFKKPSEEEFAHDFLWRVHQQTPPKGMMHIFNRSHYEDVLIQRVHHWIDEERVDFRFEAINAFEKLLQREANTIIFKFYLHISYEQQEIELNERLEEADKHWKHNDNDWKEREKWNEYRKAYQDILNRSEVPWYVIPVDKRWYRNYLVAQTLVAELEKLDLAYPPLERS